MRQSVKTFSNFCIPISPSLLQISSEMGKVDLVKFVSSYIYCLQ